ncbi:energy-coupling factor ABC transporter substrate-binding protein [Thermotalea metallivorans]|uniref:Cobalt transport protein CbiN n=1 Tax=Thermotalea metallivorans TaxID=520762 RepID=A0A140L4F7_9FIRM|nr:energy-coupling factor ABC transporter substrate-binding protein [Thermotalea metallivorans]KXG75432.1 Cobalt transport protein CbiN [Thermotalea metallivorans]
MTIKKNMILLFLAVMISIAPLIMNPKAEYGGADGAAEEMITQIRPDYQPWFSSIWEPPSGEIESLLFALQAGLGAGIIGYYMGYSRGKKNHAKVTNL